MNRSSDRRDVNRSSDRRDVNRSSDRRDVNQFNFLFDIFLLLVNLFFLVLF
jgi:hypothetical protein